MADSPISLTMFERLMLLKILPREGSIDKIKTTRELREMLSPTPEEHQSLDFGVPCKLCGNPGQRHEDKDHKFDPLPGSVVFNRERDQKVELEFNPVAFMLVRDALVALSTAEGLTEGHIDLYETFVGGKDRPGLELVK